MDGDVSNMGCDSPKGLHKACEVQDIEKDEEISGSSIETRELEGKIMEE